MWATVSASKRSVAYSSQPSKPLADSESESVRSNIAVPECTSSKRDWRPGSTGAPTCAPWRMNITWKRGVCPRSRVGWSASTSFSKGTS
ncbi:hypothetical protein COEX109129_42045 [Corallococcus exiguus]